MHKLVMAVAALALAFSAHAQQKAAPAPAGDEKTLMQIEEDMARAIVKRDIATLNRFRRENPALHELTNLHFLDCPDPNILAYAKATADRRNIAIVVVNLDAHAVHGGELMLPLSDWGLTEAQEFVVEEAFTGRVTTWRGNRQH